MPTGGVPADEHATGITPELLGVLDDPRDRFPYFGDDLVEPRRRRQRVFDHRQVEARREDALAQEGVRLLVVRLPVAAVDVDERGRRRPAAREEVQTLPRAVAVAEVDPATARFPQRVAPRRPVRDVPFAPGRADRGGVVVRGVEHRTVHPAVEHRNPSFQTRRPLSCG